MQPLFAAAVPAPRIAGVTAPPWPRRVAVFRALQLGDLLCAVPALRAVRAAMPNAHITLIGLPWARDFARRFRHYVDDFLDFSGAPGLIERTPAPGEYAAFLAAAQARRFDLALQLHGDGSHSNAVVRALGARYTVGCHPAETAAADPRYSLEYPEQLPEIRRLLAPLAHVGIAARGEQLEFPVTAEDEAALDAAWPQRGHGRYICLHPGARMPSRRWPAAYFARIAVACAEAGYVPVFTGSAEERPLVEAVLRELPQPCAEMCVDLCGRTGLGAFAALLRAARLVISNDTGTSHVAAAVGAPSVVLYGGSAPDRWAPLDEQRHRRALIPVACRPCYHWHCPVGHVCMTGLTPETVWRHIRDALIEPVHTTPVQDGGARPCADFAS